MPQAEAEGPGGHLEPLWDLGIANRPNLGDHPLHVGGAVPSTAHFIRRKDVLFAGIETAAQKSARERNAREHAETLRLARGKHATFGRSIESVVDHLDD